MQEAQHVFIKHGLHYVISKKPTEICSILKIGFGTGLNAFLTCLEAKNLNVNIDYTGVEAYPVSQDELQELNYGSNKFEEDIFKALHESEWENKTTITNKFSLTKQQRFFKDIKDQQQYNIIYFDAFGARVQPELWTETIFKIMFEALKPHGVLVTYSAKGSVRRAMQAVGFVVERLPGPPGKREMLRACKEI